MGRPKGSRNKKSSSESGPPPNGPDPQTIAEFADKFDIGLDEIEEAKRPYDAATARFRALRKAAKANHIDVDNLLTIVKFRRFDPSAFQVDTESRIRLARILDLPIGTQLSLIPPPDIPDNVASQVKLSTIERAGFKVGKSGGGRTENNQKPGSEHYAAWDNGWIRGTKTLAGGVGMATAGLRGGGAEDGGLFGQSEAPAEITEKALSSHLLVPRKLGGCEGFKCVLRTFPSGGRFVAGFEWTTGKNGGGTAEFTTRQLEDSLDTADAAQRKAAAELVDDLKNFQATAGDEVGQNERESVKFWIEEIKVWLDGLAKAPVLADKSEGDEAEAEEGAEEDGSGSDPVSAVQESSEAVDASTLH